MKKLLLLVGLVMFLAPSLAYSEWSTLGSSKSYSCTGKCKIEKRKEIEEMRKRGKEMGNILNPSGVFSQNPACEENLTPELKEKLCNKVHKKRYDPNFANKYKGGDKSNTDTKQARQGQSSGQGQQQNNIPWDNSTGYGVSGYEKNKGWVHSTRKKY